MKVDNASLLSSRLEYFSQSQPEKDAIVTPDFALSYAQLARMVAGIALELVESLEQRATLLAIQCENDTWHLIASLAAVRAGFPSVSIPPGEKDEQLALFSQHFENIVSVDDDWRNRVDVETQKAFQDDLLGAPILDTPLYFLTSGTTARPKIVCHSSSSIVEQAPRHVDSKEDRFACHAKMHHNFVKRHRLYCVAEGATNIIIPSNNDRLVEHLADLSASVLHVTAYQAQELIARASDLEQLSGIMLKLGGSHVNRKLRSDLRAHFPNRVRFGFGTTETGAISFSEPTDTDEWSVGKPLSGLELKVVDSERNEVGVGDPGEIAIRGKGLFGAYLGNESQYNDRVESGWYYTNDLGRLDSAGNIIHCGRVDDMFTYNSINIYPSEIEAILNAFEFVIETAVVPKRSDVHGQIPVALVVFEKNRSDLDLLKSKAREALANRCPVTFIEVDQIPKTAAGKLHRADAVRLSGDRDQVRDDLWRAIKQTPQLYQRFSHGLTDFAKGSSDIDLGALNLDSLSRMEFLALLETRFNFVLDMRALDLESDVFLGDVVTQICSPERALPDLDACVNAKLPFLEAQLKENRGAPAKPVALFKRAFSAYGSVADFNKMLSVFERNFSPRDFFTLLQSHLASDLLSGADQKFHHAATKWFLKHVEPIAKCNSEKIEAYKMQRLSPHLRFFSNGDNGGQKRLLIAYSASGAGGLMVPNFCFLQCINAEIYDVLFVAEPHGQSYVDGVPWLGDDEVSVARGIAEHLDLNAYYGVTVTGLSAGAYAAVIGGVEIGAERIVSIAGRMHKFKQRPLQVLRRWMSALGTRPRSLHTQIDYCFSLANSRDRRYAKVMRQLTGGELKAVACDNIRLRHLFLGDLLANGLLRDFVRRYLILGEPPKRSPSE